jgi:hypothetical protein
MRRSVFYLLAISFIFCSSCHENPLKVDVSGIKIEDVKIRRFEQDLFKPPFNPGKLSGMYGDFFRGFVETSPFCPNGIDDPGCQAGIRGFVTDPDMKAAYESCQKEFPDVHELEQKLDDAFRHFKYHFPSRPLPKVCTMMSGFNFNILKLDKAIGIGLEMYLGPNSVFYRRIEFPKYKIIKMSREYLIPDFVRGWMLTEFEEKNAKPDFLTRIIEEGKIAYLVDAMLPEMNDTLKIGFSKNQLDWCKQNEGHMWSFFIKRKILYTRDYQEIMQFTNDGPFTTGFAKESPSRTGNWIGWQIIRSYMEKNKNTTLQQLMEMKDAQKILAAAAYKPKL